MPPSMIQSYPEFGYMEYAGTGYFSKHALLEAMWRDSASSSAKFRFHEEFFFKRDCTVEPEGVLEDLYRQRAEQLRQEFGSLILLYSGGSDSHNILKTFLDNGVFLDRVMTRYPTTLIDTLETKLPAQDHPLAMLYEYQQATVPGLQLVTKQSSNTEVVVVDTTAAYQAELDDAWLELAVKRNRLCGGLYQPIYRHAEAHDLARVTDALGSITVGVIYGTEKPWLLYKEGHIYLYFDDVGRVGMDSFTFLGRPNYRPIMFYWGDPSIPLKQAHLVKQAFEASPDALAWLRVQPPTRFMSLYDCPHVDIKQVIYPWWDGRFQAVKSQNEGIAVAINPRIADIALEKITYVNDRYQGLRSAKQLTWDRPGKTIMRVQTDYHDIGVVEGI